MPSATLFKIDDKSLCGTCGVKAKESEIIRCSGCESFFHAICSHPSGASEICKPTFLKIFLQSTTKPNFQWLCDSCLTKSEENRVAHLSDKIDTLSNHVQKLQNIDITTLKNEITKQLKKDLETHITDQLSNLKNVDNSSGTVVRSNVWDNPAGVQGLKELKTSLLIKPDTEGNPLDLATLKDIVVEHGIPLNSTVVSSSGDTFLNLPNAESREKLKPLLQTVQPNKDIITLKSKQPSIAILGVTEDLKSDEIIRMIRQQNDAINNLVDQGAHMSVVYTKKPKDDQRYHQVVMRVSPDIRRAMRVNGNKIHMGHKVHKIVDRFYVKRCNTCQGFGHYSDDCKKTHVCGYCAEKTHSSADCPLKSEHSDRHTCSNCKAVNHKDKPASGHSTFSIKCPAYLDQQNKLKHSIGYNYESNQ